MNVYPKVNNLKKLYVFKIFLKKSYELYMSYFRFTYAKYLKL